MEGITITVKFKKAEVIEQEVYVCQTCGNSYAWFKTLKSHVSKKHPTMVVSPKKERDDRIMCQLCKEEIPKNNIVRHLVGKHKIEKRVNSTFWGFGTPDQEESWSPIFLQNKSKKDLPKEKSINKILSISHSKTKKQVLTRAIKCT